MGFQKLFEVLADLDIKTIIGVLIWGNLALAFLTLQFYLYHGSDHKKDLILRFGVAKITQAAAWVLLFLRGNISDLFSICFGNILLFVSFYLDSLIILKMNKEIKTAWFRLQDVLLALSVILFALLELLLGMANIRVAMASLGVFFVLVVPNILSIANKQSSKFERFIGFVSVFFLILLLLRAIYSLFDKNVNLFTGNLLQSGTFLLLVLLMFVNGTGFLLVMYERSYELLKASSNLDPLTKIYNRRYFMGKAEAYYERALRDEKSLSLLFIDIDFFKKANDTYGHLFGDEVLKVVAKVISENVRPLDLCCRYGGEEFLILLHDASREQAVSAGNRIREKIEDLTFEENPEYKCTVSVGIYSGIPDNEKSAQFYIDYADQALYMAKESGRNCVVSI
ncbi:MAG: GGDEF domain-containing protein [Ruminococcaceae bacterium]|nr:GGDEF domain-containing protein [Oscillospiraceae bacterium]